MSPSEAPALASSPAVAWINTSVADGGVTSNATATFEFNGTDSTGVRFTCTLTARWAPNSGRPVQHTHGERPALPSLPALPCSNPSPLQPAVVTTAGNLSEQAVPLGQPFPCSSPLTLRWLLPASWQLGVAGQDTTGSAAAPLRLSWRVELESRTGLVPRFTRCGLLLTAGWLCAEQLHCLSSSVALPFQLPSLSAPCCSGPFGAQLSATLPAFSWLLLDASGQAAPTDALSFECSLRPPLERGGERAHRLRPLPSVRCP